MSLDLWSILPELVLSGGGMLLLLLPRLKNARLLGLLTLLFLVAAGDLKFIGFLKQRGFSQALFSGMLIQDRFSLFFQMAVLATAALITLSVMGYAREEVRGRREFHSLLLWATVGLLLVVAAQHLMLIYLGLEMVSLLSYLMTGFQKRESLAAEGALKYFLFGALSTGAMLYGISLLYGLSGSMDLATLASRFPKILEAPPGLTWAALLLILVGVGFKIALVPFHMWAPDAYEGASTPVASFLSLGPKLAGFAVLTRILWVGFSPIMDPWPTLLGILAVLTMTVGNLAALAQSNVKRLLAYSSIAHAGTMVIGLAVATPFGLSALLYYLVAYLLMNAGAFAGVIAVGNTPAGAGSGREDLRAFSGLGRREPALAFLMAVCLLSLAGIPPLAGFFAKMWIFAAALKAQATGLAIAAAVNSVLSVFYYSRILQAMYLEPAPAAVPAVPRSRSLYLVLGLCAAGLFAVGLGQGSWLELSAQSLPVPPLAGEV